MTKVYLVVEYGGDNECTFYGAFSSLLKATEFVEARSELVLYTLEFEIDNPDSGYEEIYDHRDELKKREGTK